ncbi:hypothetical protein BpHYR1_030943 [Brachionus plicatilis]|uniref:Uncharacterized protein n=1 Tax=Brachionus plicatilis TaxID=10195 RepID=A0A3M7SWG7_BRAPC|nr:hypothetical protein BpHYR1_030943 [Brachionus plicatilis]
MGFTHNFFFNSFELTFEKSAYCTFEVKLLLPKRQKKRKKTKNLIRVLFSYQILKKLRIEYKLIRTVHAYAIRIIEKKAPTGVEVTDTLAVFSDHDSLYSSTIGLRNTCYGKERFLLNNNS